MKLSETFFVDSPIGRIQIFCCENKVLEINLGIDSKKRAHSPSITKDNNLSLFAQSVKSQLGSYFQNANASLKFNLQAEGTNFQKSVWRIIKSIKKGETLTYTDVAQKLNSSPRAVGNACRANPIPIIVPCHRVISKAGLGGFAGQRDGNNVDVKSWLLQHEQNAI